ncbi:MAG: rhamnulokinase family protein [Treponemataceae bacterium]|nr:MAG: rhamnulokinase family protein [Treponemataceae bacterium]
MSLLSMCVRVLVIAKKAAKTHTGFVDYFLAIDIGASSGRHILSHLENGRLVLEEMHRFANGAVNQDGRLVWDTEALLREIRSGIAKCAAACASGGKTIKTIKSIGIDTWAVDYVLLDKACQPMLPVYAYRDGQSAEYVSAVDARIAPSQLYGITGLPRHPFNTIYQLLRDKDSGRLAEAAHFVMLPEYFSYRLATDKSSGQASSQSIGDFAAAVSARQYCEYTNASTTGLLDATTRDWSDYIIDTVGLPRKLFAAKPKLPPFVIGKERTTGADIVMVASHDTASAVSVLPDGDESLLYISSGTWSLLGVQSEPLLTQAAMEACYANEGGARGKIRFLKNIMGLWMIQSVRRELGGEYSFADLEREARAVAANRKDASGASSASSPEIDVNSSVFLNPPAMIAAIQAECAKTAHAGQRVPQEAGEIALCVYENLSRSYAEAISALEKVTGKTYTAIRIIGGGSKDTYLNELTQKMSGKKVIAGPAEATAIGNILRQMEAHGIVTEEIDVY